MHRPKTFSNASLHHVQNLISRSSLRRGLPVVLLVLGLFALSPTARAVNPPPDGGYPGNNTAEGDNALFSLTTGADNTAIGFDALFSNTTGLANTATGFQALQSNTNGINNTASGFEALTFNTTGSNNTANSVNALFDNNADNNTGTGGNALSSNTTGTQNTATGVDALESNKIGNYNTATGVLALNHNTSGSNNVASGVNALYTNQRGRDNTAEGFQALKNNTGSSNIAMGSSAGVNLTTGSNNIDIGNQGVAGDSNTIRIGGHTPNFGFQTATFIAGIHGVAVTGSAVVVNSTGQLGTAPSSERFKEAIKPMDKASEAILALKPVTFRYKQDLDPDGIPQFGLVAEQVEKVNPDLVVRGEDEKVNTVRYDAVNAMLLNEFLKAYKKVEE